MNCAELRGCCGSPQEDENAYAFPSAASSRNSRSARKCELEIPELRRLFAAWRFHRQRCALNHIRSVDRATIKFGRDLAQMVSVADTNGGRAQRTSGQGAPVKCNGAS